MVSFHVSPKFGASGATGTSTRRSATATPQERSGQQKRCKIIQFNEFSKAKYRVFVGFEGRGLLWPPLF